MKRKIIHLGPSYAISLPKKWVDRYNVYNMSEIDVEETKDGILQILPISSSNVAKDIEFKINKDESINHIYYSKIYRAYAQGYKNITLIGDFSQEQFKVMSKVQKKLIGLEVIEQTERKIILKDFMNLEDVDIDTFMNRAFNNIIGMGIELITKIKSGEVLGDKLKDMDSISNRGRKLINRYVTIALYDSNYMKKLNKDTSELIIIAKVTENIRQIGYELVDISFNLNEVETRHMKEFNIAGTKRDKNIDSYIIQFLTAWLVYIKEVRSVFFKKEISKATDMYINKHSSDLTKLRYNFQKAFNETNIDLKQIINIENCFISLISNSSNIAKHSIIL
ncbi:MAG: hypothetical protein K0B02_01400 [DPANN group archaeon]|nr:hypothetical protein [DPANN group archaeon]